VIPGKEIWEKAGCGLGWQVTKKRTMIATTTRGTTNGFVHPSYGMTSGTIGCEQHSFAQEDRPAAAYVASNQEQLKMEMAEGRGEYLSAFARTLGCSDADLGAFGQMTQKNYESIVDDSSENMLKNVKREMQKDSKLNGCSV